MNIMNAFEQMHNAGIRANLLDNYNPANLLEGTANQLVRFKCTNAYNVIPAPEISSAGNLNLKFCLQGKAIDTTNNVEYDAVQFKTVSIVKNKQLFKNTLTIHQEDVQSVVNMGFKLVDDKLDLTQFSLTDDMQSYTGFDLAKAAVEQMMYNCTREIKKRKKVELTGNEKFLAENGFKNGVWSPIIISSTERVKNTFVDNIQIVIDNVKCPHHIDAINEKLNANKKITALDEKIKKLSINNYIDNKQVINKIKYTWLMTKPEFGTYEVEFDDVHFTVEITEKM